MDSNHRWHQLAVKGLKDNVFKECCGQSTLEYALLLGAFLVVITALAAIWKLGLQGELARLSSEAASHVVGSLAGFRDIALF